MTKGQAVTGSGSPKTASAKTSPAAGDDVPAYFLDENVGRQLLLGFRIFERSLLRHIADQGFDDIRMSHLPIMRNIARGGLRTTEIADMAGMTKQTAGMLSTDLETMRYIKRVPDPSDGRAKLVRFTPRGKQFMADFPAALEKAEADMIALIGDQDFGMLTEILRKLIRGSGESPSAMAP